MAERRCEYDEVREILLELKDRECLANDAYASALRVVAFIELCQLPAPQLLTHGEGSIVLEWELLDRTVYITVSATNVSWLCTSSERILSRLDTVLTR